MVVLMAVVGLQSGRQMARELQVLVSWTDRSPSRIPTVMID